MKFQSNFNKYRLWLAFPFAYGVYIVTFIGFTLIMPLISDGGCSGGWGDINPEFYSIFVPRFMAAAFFVFCVSLIFPDKKLFYSTIASILLISLYVGPNLFPAPPFLSEYFFPVDLWRGHLPTICLLIAADLSSLGSLAGLGVAYWMWKPRSSNK